jgi:hypothetical protein
VQKAWVKSRASMTSDGRYEVLFIAPVPAAK